MGDYYNVTLEDYHKWDRQTALRRCQMHGHPLASIQRFFALYPDDQEWIEVEFCAVITDFQSYIFEEPGFVIRLLEESLDTHYEETNPIRERYPDLWEMEFSITKDNPSIVWIMAHTNHEGEKIWPEGGNTDDAMEVRFLVPSRFVPSFDPDKGNWDGRGWHTNDRNHLQSGLHYGLRHAECRLLRRDIVVDQTKVYTNQPNHQWQTETLTAAITQISPSIGEDGICFWTDAGSGWQSRPDNTLQAWEAPSPQAKRTPCGRALWWLTAEKLHLHHTDDTHHSYPLPAPHPEGSILLLSTSLQPALIAPDLAFRWQRDGVWLRMEHTIKSIKDAVFGTDDTLWIAGLESLCCCALDGSSRQYQAQDGLLGRICSLIALPHGIIWVRTSEQFVRLYQLHKDAHRIQPVEDLYQLAPEKLLHGAMGPDGSLWLLSEYSHLLRLQEGKLPRYYAWDETLPTPTQSRWHTPDFWVSPQGDIFCFHKDRGFCLFAESIRKADALPAENAELFLPGQLEPFHFPNPQGQTWRESAIDLRGKNFHFIGKLDTLSRPQAKEELQQLGASVRGTLSKRLDYVVRGANPHQYSGDWNKQRSYWDKIEEAEKMMISVLTEHEFLVLTGKARPTESIDTT